MNAESWTQLNRLLDEALDLPPADRERWLARLGPENEPLKARLCALLAQASSVQASSFLAPPNLGSLALSEFPDDGDQPRFGPDADQPGAIIGPYRLLRSIGAGGMGAVWLAERADGLFQRQVALKLPRGAWPRADLVERMARERDILAALTHANIARLYEAGITAGGRPYLALEYVEGRTIDAYCAGKRLDVSRARSPVPAGRRGRCLRPCTARRASRSQTFQHPRDERRPDPPAGLRYRQAARRRERPRHPADRALRPAAYAGVRVARTDRRRATRDRHRHLFAGRRALRAAGRDATVTSFGTIRSGRLKPPCSRRDPDPPSAAAS